MIAPNDLGLFRGLVPFAGWLGADVLANSVAPPAKTESPPLRNTSLSTEDAKTGLPPFLPPTPDQPAGPKPPPGSTSPATFSASPPFLQEPAATAAQTISLLSSLSSGAAPGLPGGGGGSPGGHEAQNGPGDSSFPGRPQPAPSDANLLNAAASTPTTAAPPQFQVHGAWFQAAVGAAGFAFSPTAGASPVAVQFVGAHRTAAVSTTAAKAGTAGFFAAAGHATFAGTQFHGIYRGIDLRYNPTPSHDLEYSFAVAPGAKAGAIRMNVQGANALAVDPQGNLVIHTPTGNLISTVPVLFQKVHGSRVPVQGGYALHTDGTVGFWIGRYNHTRELFIDPDFGNDGDGSPTVTIAATDANAAEPGTDTGTFTVTRTGSTSSAMTVSYSVSGTATSGDDYQSLSGSVVIPSGSATATITVTPVDDDLKEDSETVIATLTSGTGYTVGSPSSGHRHHRRGRRPLRVRGRSSHAAGDAVNLQAAPATAQGDYLFGQSGLPAGLAIDTATGAITGQIAYTAAETSDGEYAVTLTALDTSNQSHTLSFTWTVINNNTDPVLASPGDRVNAAGDSIALSIQASDADGDALTLDADGLPPGLAFNATTHLITGSISATADDSTPYAVTLSAADGTTTVYQTFTWSVTYLFLGTPDDRTSWAGDAVALPVQAISPHGDPLTYSASGLPDGLSLNTSTGLITGTVAAAAADDDPHTVTLGVTDGTHSSGTSFDWTVPEVVVVNPGTQVTAEGDTVDLAITALDADEDELTYGAEGLPPGLAIDSDTGEITGTTDPLSANDSPYSVTVTATDGTHSTDATFDWVVTHILLDNPGASDPRCRATVSLQVVATDPTRAH